MTDIEVTIASFKARQQTILDLNAEFIKQADAFGEECQSRIEAIKTEFEVKKAELGAEFEKAKASYKADMKTAFGVTDGESANILDLVQLIRRVTVPEDFND